MRRYQNRENRECLLILDSALDLQSIWCFSKALLSKLFPPMTLTTAWVARQTLCAFYMNRQQKNVWMSKVITKPVQQNNTLVSLSLPCVSALFAQLSRAQSLLFHRGLAMKRGGWTPPPPRARWSTTQCPLGRSNSSPWIGCYIYLLHPGCILY